jgi:YD repeat-containing protein
MKKFRGICLCALLYVLSCVAVQAATFDGHAGLAIPDSTDSLSWKSENDVLSVYCWFKISVPTGESISDNMTILVDRRDGNESSTFAYLIRYNYQNGKVEFLSNGPDGTATVTLIETPYLDRWYHVVVVRSGSQLYSFVDGKANPVVAVSVGSTANSNGISIGCWGFSQYFYGEIQEIAILQSSIVNMVEQLRFLDLAPAYHQFLRLTGYYKLTEIEPSQRFKNTATGAASDTINPSIQGSGVISVSETETSSEQSLFDANKNGGENAIVPLSGAFTWQGSALNRPTPGIHFSFDYSYSSSVALSAQADDGLQPNCLTPGWRHQYEMRIAPTQSSTERQIIMPTGAIETWYRDETEYKTRHGEYRGKLEKLVNDDYVWTSPGHLKHYFYDPTYAQYPWEQQKRGRLYRIEDTNGNQINILWDFFSGLIERITDSIGGEYIFVYNSQFYLESVSYKQWSVNFEYSANHLSAISWKGPPEYQQLGTQQRFEYNGNGLLNKIYDPNCTYPAQEITYDAYGRMIEIKDAAGNKSKIEYDTPNPRQIRRTDEESHQWIETYDRKHRMIESKDPKGNIRKYTYDSVGNMLSETDAKGNTTKHTYDNRSNRTSYQNPYGYKSAWKYHDTFNKVIESVNPKGWKVHYVYDDQGNLVRQYDGMGNIVQYAYYPNGLVRQAIDANNNIEQFAYDPNGFLTCYTDPNGFQTTSQYNDLGWKTKAVNPLFEETAFSYNINGQIISVEDSLHRIVRSDFDERGNLLESIDAKGYRTYYEYNLLNQLTKTTDPNDNETLYEYTPRGKLAKVTDPLGNFVANTYDELNLLQTITDANSFTVELEYDKRQ